MMVVPRLLSESGGEPSGCGIPMSTARADVDIDVDVNADADGPSRAEPSEQVIEDRLKGEGTDRLAGEGVGPSSRKER
jgi:hypothetical protein